MKKSCAALLLVISSATAFSAPLTNSDREAILEQLETVGAEATAKVDSRFSAAISAYRSAMASGDAAMDLYLKCEEMVNFEQMKKSNSDFREWKRQNADKLSDKAFREALRQQLRWLVLTLEAASKDADRDRLSVEASKTLDAIVSGAKELAAQRSVLGQGVTATVFARAYGINSLKVEDWPLAPIPVAAVYDQSILPPMRRTDRIQSLRSAWMKRISQEAELTDAWSGEETKGSSGGKSAAYEKFVSDTLPNLKWDAETDLFKAGDEQAAAANMLKHIRENMSHESAPKWIGDLKTMIGGPAKN